MVCPTQTEAIQHWPVWILGPAGLRITAQCCLLVEPGDWRILPVVNDLEINRSQFSSSHGVVTVLKTQREEDHSRTDSRTCLWQEG